MKSKCRYIRELLSEYIDGVMDATERDDVKEHLQVCKDCRREHDAMKSLIDQLGNIRQVKAPDNFLETFHERISDDSFFDRIRSILSFTGIKIPVEVAAFAVTAVLIFLFFNLFPDQQRGVINNFENNNGRQTVGESTLPAQIAENNISLEQPLKSPSLETQSPEQRIPIELTLSITAGQDTEPIPSQSVSFGTYSSEYPADELDLWMPKNESLKKMHPDEVNSRIEEIINSVEGKTLTRDFEGESGYPTGLALDIPGANYSMFISKIETIGALQSPAPSLPVGSEETMILIKMELIPPE